MAILEVNDVTIAYGAAAAVSGVSFALPKGDYFCVVGPNGSGKSTLIKGILGLKELSRGSVKLGVELSKVAYLPQLNTLPADFPATVKELVLTGAQKRRRPFYTRQDRSTAQRSMELLGIADLAQARIGELSGGQQQRVFFARALCREPELLVLDEPFAGLDEGITHSLQTLLGKLNGEGVTLLMVSHDLQDVRAHARHVAVLNRTMQYCGDVSGAPI